MKKLVIFLSLASLMCLLGFSCEKDGAADSLPPATTTGAATMGFLVDGKVWVAKSDDFKVPKTGAKYWTSFGLIIYGVNHAESRFSMTLANPKEGNYIFGNGDQIRNEGYNSSTVFSLDPNNTSNSLIITRYDGNIISGKFSFNLKSSDGSTVSITSGRFDIPVK